MQGSLLAVGTFSGRLYIYDASTLQLSRQYTQAHSQRIGSLAWNSHLLSSGSRDRMIHHRDVREPGIDPVRRSNGHRQEVCGLKWSNGVDGGHASGVGSGPAGLLASGGNDNKVCIWDLRGSRRPPTTTPSNMVSVGLGSRDTRASASGSASGSGDEANGGELCAYSPYTRGLNSSRRLELSVQVSCGLSLHSILNCILATSNLRTVDIYYHKYLVNGCPCRPVLSKL